MSELAGAGDPADEGLHARQPIELSSDSESGDSRIGDDESASGRVACPWRTSRFHDLECSRYFDCPSHTIERALSEGDGDNQDSDGNEEVGAEGREADHVAIQPVGDDLTGEDGTPPVPLAAVAPTTPHNLQPPNPAAGIQGGAAPGTAENPVVVPDGSPSPPPSPARTDRNPVVIEDDDDMDTGEGSAQHTARQSVSSITSGGTASREGVDPILPGPAVEIGNATNPTAPSPAPRNTARIDSPSVELPRWQPDAEVTYCPICHTQFSIFIRKHHCRKCGRVVCGACSPHRIIIPYRYIVQQPGTFRMPAPTPTPSLGRGETGDADFDSLGGGERVRLCNPCVPDPNFTPPQAQNQLGQRTHARSRSGVNQGHPSISPALNPWSAYFGVGSGADAYARGRSVTMAGNTSSPSSTRPPSSPYTSTAHNRILAGTPPAYFPPQSSAAQRLYGDQDRYRPLLDFGGPGPSTAAAGSSSSSASLANRRLPPIPQPRQQIAEEDECPVCHRELPERTLANFEALREAHITICIATHSGYGSTPTASPGGGDRGGGGGDAASPPPPPPPPRRTGMFPYTATEKDCVDSAECTICLEEFEVGVPMARLECLCRFHRRCISAWWQRHPGRCPMHQHDSFGY